MGQPNVSVTVCCIAKGISIGPQKRHPQLIADPQAEQQGQVQGQRQLPASFRQGSKAPQAMGKDSAEYRTITRSLVKMIVKLSVAGSHGERNVQTIRPRAEPQVSTRLFVFWAHLMPDGAVSVWIIM